MFLHENRLAFDLNSQILHTVFVLITNSNYGGFLFE